MSKAESADSQFANGLTMSAPTQSIINTRRDQMFPDLARAEIERLRRFGEVRSYGDGEALAKVGEGGLGLTIILSGKVDITRRDQSGRRELIVTHGPGAFIGELAQLAGRPALVDAYAKGPVEALIIAPERLRALLVAEAELGERIMRALILRRVGLLETGAGGPVIIGGAENGDVLRLEGFLSRKGHPHQRLNPATDPEAKALIERFRVDAHELPIVLCPGGRCCAIPVRPNWPVASGWWRRSIHIASMTWPSSGQDQLAWPPQSTRLLKSSPSWCWTAGRLAAKPALRRGLRTTSASRRALAVWP